MTTSRLILPGLLLVAGLACDPFGDAQRADTIEAYEAYLADNPDGAKAFMARARLEELYVEKARASGRLEDWDAVLERFPDGALVETVNKERADGLYQKAERAGTPEAWQAFLDAVPNPGQKRGPAARAALEATTYARAMTFTPVRTRKVNLAEDPNGPLDGTAFEVDVTNGGDRTLEAFWLRVFYLGADDVPLAYRDWPVVAPYRDFPVPVEEELTVPMKPGDVRTWSWWAGDMPEGWSGRARVVPLKLRFAEGG